MSAKKLLIIGSPSGLQEPETLSILDFTRKAIGNDEVTVNYCRVDQVIYVVGLENAQMIDGANGGDVADNDVVWFRGKLSTVANDVANIANYLENKGIKTANSFYSRRRAVGKVAQMYALEARGLPIPRTVSAAPEFMAENATKNLEYPMIVKDCHGSHGEHNYLVKSEAELSELLNKYPEIRFMAQEFIEGTGDYRILFAGSEHIVIHRLGSDDTHLNNTSQGASASLIPADEFAENIIADARIFADISEYEIAGVDVIISKATGQHYFLEINSQPQVATGAFVVDKEQLVGSYFRGLLGL